MPICDMEMSRAESEERQTGFRQTDGQTLRGYLGQGRSAFSTESMTGQEAGELELESYECAVR